MQPQRSQGPTTGEASPASIVVLIVGMLLGLVGCGSGQVLPTIQEIRHSSIEVPDPALDAEIIGPSTRRAPDVDLTSVAAGVDGEGLQLTLRYAEPVDLSFGAHWGIRFEVLRSSGSTFSVAWDHYLGSGPGRYPVQIAPRIAGCRAAVHLEAGSAQVGLDLSPTCLPLSDGSSGPAWVQIESLESRSSWRDDGTFNYASDRLFGRRTSDGTARLYLP